MMLQLTIFLVLIFIILSISFTSTVDYLGDYVFAAQSEFNFTKQPIINNTNLKVELVSSGLRAPTSMAFLDDNDLIILERFNGTVIRIINDIQQPDPLLDVNIARVTGERGMLGVTVSKNVPGHTYVFFYYTESNSDNGEPIGNRLYRYELVNDKLVNPKLLIDLPVKPGPYHNGGGIRIGPDNNIYLPIGDLDNVSDKEQPSTQAQNIKRGEPPNGTGGILRITQNGKPVGDGLIGDEFPLNLYYAYGIRNSFGLDFDPETGNLWDTENGPNYGDEINLVEPGFNSGWSKVQGIWKGKANIESVAPDPPKGLVDFSGKGKYSAPEFMWKSRHGPTALKFLDSDKLGKEYENDLFVGDLHNGTIYHFELNKERTELSLNGPLEDKIADENQELKETIFAQGFEGGITDLEVGPDGYLYVVSGGWRPEGNVYRIVPQD
jgi:glucose/arabinose dehydrogenase